MVEHARERLGLPETGRRLAPRLLAEVGDDASRYESAVSLQALGGTLPVLFQSDIYSTSLTPGVY